MNIQVHYSKIKGTGERIGGCIGYAGSYSLDKIKSSNNIIVSKNEGPNGYLGGCIGYVDENIWSMESTDNIIRFTTESSAKDYRQGVGGCIGFLNVWSTGSANWMTSSGCEIYGATKVGGVVGMVQGGKNAGVLYNITSKDQKVYGSYNYIGGCFGISSLRIRNAKTRGNTISGGDTTKGGEYVGGIVGLSSYNNASTGINSYSIGGAYVYNTTISANKCVGGISGNARGTVYATGVDNTTINCRGDYAGGIIGYYKGSSDNTTTTNQSKNYYLLHSFCTNSTVTAQNNAGGLIGGFIYGNIQYCYVGNTDVIAINDNAGGLVGYLNNTDMTDKQFIATIKYNYIANVEGQKIVSSNVTGGLIGSVQIGTKEVVTGQDDDGNNIATTYGLRKDWISNNLVVTDIQVINSTDYISMGIGKINQNDSTGTTPGINISDKMSKIYIYENSYIYKPNNNSVINQNEKNAYNTITASELGSASTYQSGKKLGFFDSSSKRFSFEQGYFPSLKLNVDVTVSNPLSWSRLNVDQPKIATPTGMLHNEANSISTLSLRGNGLNTSNQLPSIFTYAVDVNKINIEFGEIIPYTYFEIKTNDGKTILSTKQIEQKVYTLNYDFNTPLVIKVSNLNNWYTKDINAGNVQNLLDIVNEEYIYLNGTMLHSNKKELYGEYLNLYDGKALSIDGNIYDIGTMEIVGRNDNEIRILDKETPIAESNYEGITIQAFYHCSRVINEEESVYKDQQIFIKNNQIYLADGDLEILGDAIIIDSYNNHQYQTVLGVDGKLYDLLTKIKYPENFENQNIIDMTNNINSNSSIVLVYYSNGNVCAFDYITGEEVYNNNVGEETKVSLLKYVVDSFNMENILYDIDKKSYKENQELVEKLEKVSIQQALEDVDIDKSQPTQEQQEENNAQTDANNNYLLDNSNDNTDKTDNVKTNISTKYVTTYNARTQNYETYNIVDVLTTDSHIDESENDKIKVNSELSKYYADMSTSNITLLNIGITVFTTILTAIFIILILLHRRNNKENR